MITGVHALIHTEDAEGVRAFFRDVLGFDHVDAHDGWPIVALPPAELGVHPAAANGGHEPWLMCDDLPLSIAELREKGVQFTREPYETSFGLVTELRLPGNGTLNPHEPRHLTAI